MPWGMAITLMLYFNDYLRVLPSFPLKLSWLSKIFNSGASRSLRLLPPQIAGILIKNNFSFYPQLPLGY